MKCSKCQSEINETDRFCPMCGTPVEHLQDDPVQKRRYRLIGITVVAAIALVAAIIAVCFVDRYQNRLKEDVLIGYWQVDIEQTAQLNDVNWIRSGGSIQILEDGRIYWEIGSYSGEGNWAVKGNKLEYTHLYALAYGTELPKVSISYDKKTQRLFMNLNEYQIYWMRMSSQSGIEGSFADQNEPPATSGENGDMEAAGQDASAEDAGTDDAMFPSAWDQVDGNMRFVFLEDGSFYGVVTEEGNYMDRDAYYSGKYSGNTGTITFSIRSYRGSETTDYVAAINGDTMTLRYDGEIDEFTRVDNRIFQAVIGKWLDEDGVTWTFDEHGRYRTDEDYDKDYYAVLDERRINLNGNIYDYKVDGDTLEINGTQFQRAED